MTTIVGTVTLSLPMPPAREQTMESSSTEVSVRAAEVGDAPAIDHLILYLDEFHANARPDLFRVPPGRPRGEDFLESALNDAKQKVLVAVRRNDVMGYVHILIKSTAASPYRVGRCYSEIDTICVHPTAQRLGTGRKLIDAALNWARSKGVQDHQIAVHEFNGPARALYEELGFVPSIAVLRQKD